MLYAGSLFDDKGNLNASLGAHEFKIEVVQAGEDGASASYRFSTRAGLIDIVAGAGGQGARRGGGRPRGSRRASMRWAGRSSILHIPPPKHLPPLPPPSLSIAC